jgi:hypothetical protein
MELKGSSNTDRALAYAIAEYLQGYNKSGAASADSVYSLEGMQ